MNTIPDRYPNLTIEELEIIGYFARGQKYSFSSKNLKLDFSETSIRLSDLQGKLLGISKQVNEWQRKVLVSNSSNYTVKIVEVLTERGFIAKQKSSHPDFTEYHYYKIPDGYKLNYTRILQLWKVWWNNKCHRLQDRISIVDPLIFNKGSWQQIKDLQPQQQHFLLQMAKGEPIVCAEDWVVWIDKFQPPPISLSPQSNLENISPQIVDTTTSDSRKTNMPTQIVTPPATPISPLKMPKKNNIDLNLAPDDEDLDLELYLSTFNTEDTEDIDRIEGIYNINELLSDIAPEHEVSLSSPKSTAPVRLEVKVIENQPIIEVPVSMQPHSSPIAPPPPPKSPKLIHTPTAQTSTPLTSSPKGSISEPSVPTSSIRSTSTLSISDRKISLKLKAFETLSKYLREGDCTTHTETIKNTQGEVINRKTTEIQRGCPNWAIDLVQSL